MTELSLSGAIGLLHPGEMGAAIGADLRAAGHEVLWASADRSAGTAQRAEASGLADVGTVEALARRSALVVSVCPPHAAEAVARALGPFAGTYVDANAIAPATSRRVAAIVERAGGHYVDGGIIGPPPVAPGTTRLYLAGVGADHVAAVLGTGTLAAHVLPVPIGAASALKMAYAAWTKGSMALVLAARAAARAGGVEDALLAEWQLSLPELEARTVAAARSAAGKGWRWIAEMDEIAATLVSAGLPGGFHLAAAEVYRRAQHAATGDVDAVLGQLLRARTEPTIGPLEPDGLAGAERLLDAEIGGRHQARLDEVHDVLALPGAVARLDGAVVGVATYGVAGGRAELAVLAVAASHAGLGIGGRLVEHVAAETRAAGARELWLVTTNDNLDALRLYQRHGFALRELRAGAVDRARHVKPAIPARGEHGIPLTDELVLVRPLAPRRSRPAG